MALTNATTLADYGAGIGTQGATLKVDATNKRVGVGTDSPAGPEGSLQVGTGITFFGNTGIVSAIGGKFSGDFTVGGTLTYEDVANIDAVGIITAQSGVSIADSIFHTGDTNTAIRFPAADTFTVETGGSERLRVDSGGKILAGGQSTRATAGLNTPLLQVEGNDSVNNSAITIVSNQNASAGPALALSKSRGTSTGSNTVVQDDDELGTIRFAGADGTDAQSIGAQITAAVDGTPGSNDLPSRLVFATTSDGAASVTERLRIDSSGRVIIGTDSGSGNITLKLQGHSGNSTQDAKIRLCRGTDSPSDTNQLGAIFFSDNSESPSADIIAIRDGGTWSGSSKPGALKFATTADGAASATERLRITSAGLIGANISTPAATLDSRGQSGNFNTTYNSFTGVSLHVRGNGTAGNGNYGSGISFSSVGGNSEKSAGIAAIQTDTDANQVGLSFFTHPSATGADAIVEKFRIEASGNIIHGKTAIKGSSGENVPTFCTEIANTNNPNVFEIANNGTNSSNSYSALVLSRSDGTTVNSHTAVDNGDKIGEVCFIGADGSDRFNTAASIHVNAAADFTANDCPADLIFSTNGGSATATERLRITSAGAVGINATNPAATFEVASTGTCSVNLVSDSDNNGAANDALISFHTNSNSGTAKVAIKYDESQTNFGIETNGTRALSIDTSQRLLIGTTSAITSDTYAKVSLVDPVGPEISLGRNDTSVTNGNSMGAIRFYGNDSNGTYQECAHIMARADGTHQTDDKATRLVFSTTTGGDSSSTERMRIDDEGIIFHVSENHGYSNYVTASAGTTKYLFRGHHSATAGSYSAGTIAFTVWSNGNVENINNSYGAISDVKLKENIVDASSQWNDIKAVQVRKYNFKASTGQPTHTQLGVVAQEIETVSPGLVYETTDTDDQGNDLGTVTKSVNYSVLYMKAIKALQEAMTRIETLEAQVAALQG